MYQNRLRQVKKAFGVLEKNTDPFGFAGDDQPEVGGVVGRVLAKTRAALGIAEYHVHYQLESHLATGRRHLQIAKNIDRSIKVVGLSTRD